ncbi:MULTISPECIES: hypothetical protein [Streptomyces]|uniref:hypothetical protein n=1 Tax=Streptomyces TaxID=1883 RepID=UPI0004922E71|nr:MULTISPECIES: hypothetical protein [Streptomyces]MYS94353.1 hypothetical protein [Streptomyces sp. SID5464]
MTNGPVPAETTGDRAHARRAGTVLHRQTAPESATPRAPRARRENERVLPPVRRRERVAAAGAGPGASACVTPWRGRGRRAGRSRVRDPG